MARKTKSRKLAMWRALPPYLGGKRRLCPLIFREIDRVVPRERWSELTFLDAFLGGGAVGLFAKAQGLDVVAADIAERSVVVGRALIENNGTTLSYEDVLRLVAPSAEPIGPVQEKYTPEVFTASQARLIDRAMSQAAEAKDPARAALLKLLAIRVALLAHPMSQIRSGTIGRVTTGEFESITPSCTRQYIEGLRLSRPAKLWELAQLINAGVFQGNAKVMKADILERLPSIQADIVYFDPPYPGTSSYEKEYRVVDEILEGAALPVSGFSAKDGTKLLEVLFDRARHIPVWILSLNNAAVSLGDLEGMMKGFGREVRSVAVKYQHKPAQAGDKKRQENREFIVSGWDDSIVSLRPIPPRTVFEFTNHKEESYEHEDQERSRSTWKSRDPGRPFTSPSSQCQQDDTRDAEQTPHSHQGDRSLSARHCTPASQTERGVSGP